MTFYFCLFVKKRLWQDTFGFPLLKELVPSVHGTFQHKIVDYHLGRLQIHRVLRNQVHLTTTLHLRSFQLAIRLGCAIAST
jgi:hypothetical protein